MKAIFFFLLAALCLAGCEKDNDHGIVTLHLLYHNEPVNGQVYIMADTLSDPGVPVDGYDQMVYVRNYGGRNDHRLPPGRYFFKAMAIVAGDLLIGTENVQVRSRTRANTYQVYITMY